MLHCLLPHRINETKTILYYKEVNKQNLLKESQRERKSLLAWTTCRKYSRSNGIRSRKKQKVGVLSTITLTYVFQKKDSRKAKHIKRLKVLLDSGCRVTMIDQKYLKLLDKKKSKKCQTKAGSFKNWYM